MFLKLSYDGVLVSMIQNESLSYKWTQGSFRTLGWIYRHMRNISYATVAVVSLQALADLDEVSKMIENILKGQNHLHWTKTDFNQFQTELRFELQNNQNLTAAEKQFFKKLLDNKSPAEIH
jgi:hypothetical protein